MSPEQRIPIIWLSRPSTSNAQTKEDGARMRAKTFVVLLGTLAVVAIASILYFVSSPNRLGSKKIVPEVSILPQPAESPAVPTTHSHSLAFPKQEGHNVIPFLSGVSNFKELADKVLQAGASDAQALKTESVALTLCEQSDAEMDQRLAHRRSKNMAPADAEDSLNALKAYKHRFCVGLGNESLGRALSEIAAMDPNGDYAISTTLTDIEPKEHAEEIATTLIETSASPDAINNAALFLATKEGGWDLGRDIVQGKYFSSELAQIQIAAAAMVACDLSGGCGADGMYSWAACSNYDMCRPGVTMEDIWRRTNSPDVLAAASKLAEILRDKRTKG